MLDCGKHEKQEPVKLNGVQHTHTHSPKEVSRIYEIWIKIALWVWWINAQIKRIKYAWYISKLDITLKKK